MRKVLISLLLASAAASPAIARPDWADRQQAHESNQQAREDRQSAREDRSSSSHEYSRPDRSSEQRSFEPRQQAQPQSLERRPSFNGGANSQQNIEAYRQRQQATQVDRQNRLEQRDQRLQQVRETNRELRQSDRRLPNVFHNPVPVVSDVPRPGTQPPLRVERNHAPVQWSSNWRHDSRYDWQNYRHHHRSHFHLGFYYDPFGWGYSPFQTGWRMWPSYYNSNFWINDPWSYRLPYAPPGTRWIRYYNDAILVDMWSGQVIDVLYNFFW